MFVLFRCGALGVGFLSSRLTLLVCYIYTCIFIHTCTVYIVYNLFSFAVVQFATGLSTLHQVAHVHTGMADCVCACGGTPYSGRPEMRIFRTS